MSGNLRRRTCFFLFIMVAWLWPYAALFGEDTHLTDYAKGCRALRFFGWQKATFWFREALAERPEPFGHPVPWSNTNPQLYLPRYVLGASLFGLGHYDEALEEWRRAEEEWSDLDSEKQRALEPYRAVIGEGRDIYRNFVCAEITPPASDSIGESELASGGTENTGLRNEIKTLCYKGQFSAAVKRARALTYSEKFVSPPPASDLLGAVAAVETIENVPVAFAQEISDCRAPEKLKQWAHLTTPEDLRNQGKDTRMTTQITAVRRVALSTIFTTILSASGGRTEIVTGGPTAADLLKSVDKVYSKKVALLISPDYKGTPWGNIKGAEEAIRLLENGLLRWGFKQENIVWLHGYVKAGDIEQQIRSFIHKNANYGDHERNLVLVHFLGHAYRRDEDDNGVLVASDSPQPRSPNDIRNIRDLMDNRSVEAGIVMSFTNQAPHHIIFSFDSCSFGEPLFTPFEGMRAIDWYTAQKNPALLFIARTAPQQIASERPALTEALGEELRGCGHGDPDGVATGWRLFSAVAQTLHDKQINDSQTLKYGLHPQWRKGDIVLRVPADCKPAAKTPHQRSSTASLGVRSGATTSNPNEPSFPAPEAALEQAHPR